jgi:hypothetical protein
MLIDPQFSKKARACLLPQRGKSLDNLVGERQQGRRNLEPGGLRGLKI